MPRYLSPMLPRVALWKNGESLVQVRGRTKYIQQTFFCCCHLEQNSRRYKRPKADLGFSRGVVVVGVDFLEGGGGGNQIDFLSSPKALRRPCFGRNFCAAGKILKKKTGQKAILGTFWKMFTKKSRFCGARALLKISIYWRQKRLKKNFRVRHQKCISKNSTKGGPFGSAGGRIPEGGGCVRLPPPP